MSEEAEQENSPKACSGPKNIREALEFALGGTDTSPTTGEDIDGVSELEGGGVLRYLGDYEIRELIARGGMGVVYRAVQRSLKREVAVKMIHHVLSEKSGMKQRFQIEAEAVATLEHPHIVSVYEVGEHEGCLYFSMRYLRGGSLSDGLVTVGDFGDREHQRWAAQVVSKVAAAIDYAHGRGVLHRDLKPANVLLDSNGEPYVTDFGLAKIIGSDTSLTRTQATLGTPAYMAPEQAAGRGKEVSTLTDVYSLGAILYECVTGKPPFEGESQLELVRQASEDEPVPPMRIQPKLSQDLAAICQKAMGRLPRFRYRSALEFSEDLDRWLRGEAIDARPIGWSERLQLWAVRRPGLAASVALTLLMAVILLVGLGLGSYQINEARKAEQWERQRAQADYNQSRLRESERYFREGDAARGLAYASAVLRDDPGNRALAEKLVYALTYHNWVLPKYDLGSQEAYRSFGPNGRSLLSYDVTGEDGVATGTLIELDSGVKQSFGEDWDALPKRIHFSYDGSLVGIHGDKGFEVRRFPEGDLVAQRELDSRATSGCLFSSGGRFLLRIHENWKSLFIADIMDAGKPLKVWDLGVRMGKIALNPVAEQIAHIAPDGSGFIGDLATGEQRSFSFQSARSLSFGKEGKWLLVTQFGGASMSDEHASISQQIAEGAIFDVESGRLSYSVSSLGVGVESVDSNLESEAVFVSMSSEQLLDWFTPEIAQIESERRQEFRPLRLSRGRQRLVSADSSQRVLDSSGRNSSQISLKRLRFKDSGAYVIPDAINRDGAMTGADNRVFLGHRDEPHQSILDSFLGEPLFSPFREPYRGSHSIPGREIAVDGRWFLGGGLDSGRYLLQAELNAGVPRLLSGIVGLDTARYFEPEKALVCAYRDGVVDVLHGPHFIANRVRTGLAAAADSPSRAFHEIVPIDGLRKVLFSVAYSGAQVWDLVSERELSHLVHAHTLHERLVYESETHRLVSSGGHSEAPTVFDLGSGERMMASFPGGAPETLAVESDGQFMILKAASDAVRLWDVKRDEWYGEAITIEGGVRRFELVDRAGFSPSGNRAYAFNDRLSAYVWSLNDEKVYVSPRPESFQLDRLLTLRFLLNESAILLPGSDGFLIHDLDGSAEVFESAGYSNILLVETNHDGNQFLVVDQVSLEHCVVELWDAELLSRIGVNITVSGRVHSVQFSGDGRRVLIVSNEEYVLWDAELQVCVYRSEFNPFQVRVNPFHTPVPAQAQLSESGEVLTILHDSLAKPVAVYHFPHFDGPIPEWLVDLVEAVGRYRLGEDHALLEGNRSQGEMLK